MEQHNYNKQHTLNDLVSEYEAMSQKGTVVFYEETVFSQIISYYENENLIELALSTVDLALSQHHYSSNLFCKKAELLALQKQESAALAAIEQAELLSPSDYEVILIKAEVIGLFGNHSLALSIIESVRDSYMGHDNKILADIYFSEGIIYERLHEYDSMFTSWKQTLMLNPTHEEALERIWICVEMSRKFKESIELCNHIINQDPYCYMAWYNLGHAHTYYGNYEEAIEAYEYAFIINNTFEWAYRDCAELCMEIQNYAKALDCYEEVLTHIQPDGELLFKIGQCYYNMGKIEIAQQFYIRSIKLDEINDEVYFHLGECWAKLGNWQKAIHYYKRAIEIEDKREDYYACLAEIYIKLERYEKAFHYFDRAVELGPEQADIWVKFATFLIEMNAYEEALDILLDANEHAIGTEILYCKAACLFQLKQESDALDVLGEALEEDFKMHSILFKYLPELKTNKKVKAIIRFYNVEE